MDSSSSGLVQHSRYPAQRSSSVKPEDTEHRSETWYDMT